MNLDEMRQIKKDRGLTFEMIADRAGISIATVKKIFCGETLAPRYDTLMKLDEVFNAERKVRETQPDYYHANSSDREYTIDDYEAFPEDYRCELIDGKIYELASPTTVHNDIQADIYLSLRTSITANKGNCYVGMAATDIKLSEEDNKTIVQPDVFVICDSKKLGMKRMTGAPDLAVEIMSPSTVQYDMSIKLMKYKETGVREYWLVDYISKHVIVHNFENNTSGIYGFRDTVPVGIYDGKISVDFSKIDDRINEYAKLCEGRD